MQNGIRNAAGVIGNCHDGLAVIRGDCYADFRVFDLTAQKSVPGVHQNVEKHLGVLVGVSMDDGIACRVNFDLDALICEPRSMRVRAFVISLAPEFNLDLIGSEEISEVVDGPGHVLDYFHAGIRTFIENFLAEPVVFMADCNRWMMSPRLFNGCRH